MDPDPGPYSEYGYGSTQVLKTDPIWIRVYNTAIYFTYTDSARHFSGISCCCDRDKLLRDILSRDKYNTCMYNAHIYCIMYICILAYVEHPPSPAVIVGHGYSTQNSIRIHDNEYV